MARRDNAPPVHPGRAPGKAGRIDAAPPDQSGAVPRHTGTPRSRTSACRGPRPRHRVASRSRSRRHTLGAMPCRRRRRRDGAPRRWSCERPESSGETPELAMGRLDAAGLRPGRPDVPALWRPHVRHRHDRGRRRPPEDPPSSRPSDGPARCAARAPAAIDARSVPGQPCLIGRLLRGVRAGVPARR